MLSINGGGADVRHLPISQIQIHHAVSIAFQEAEYSHNACLARIPHPLTATHTENRDSWAGVLISSYAATYVSGAQLDVRRGL